MRDFLPLIIVLIIVAGLVKADKVLAILYLMALLYLVSRWWSQKAIRSIKFERNFVNRAFLEQVVPVSLRLSNRSLVPVVWLQLHESLPVEMVVPGHFTQVVSLSSRQSTLLKYTLQPHKRGCYPIGPAFINSGDILGLTREEHIEIPADTLIVYPRIVSLKALGLPTHSMFGNIHETNPGFEDPSRLLGKRKFVDGDSVRKIDWKASAAVGSLQVKLFEASKSLNVTIYLDLNISSYDFLRYFDQTELAIVTAASIANQAVRQKHAVGFITNGEDPGVSNAVVQPFSPRKGNARLMHMLEIMARIRCGQAEEFPALVNRTSVNLPWGTTIVLITGKLTQALLDEILRAEKRGLNPAVINVGDYPGLLENQRRASKFGCRTYHLHNIFDIDQLSG